MKITEILKNSTKPIFSLEILPPPKGQSIDSLYDSIDIVQDFSPSFINVTYHREEYIYKKLSNNYLERIPVRRRPGTVGICAAINNRYKINTVPHLICGGFSKAETENALIDFNYLGIHNILALRGDAIKTESAFVPHPDGNKHAIDLVKQIANMNQGIYLSDEVETPKPTNFCIGVAGYPEKHFESPNIDADINFLKEKVEAGAEYIITQMFFDNTKFYRFVDKCRKMNINVPILPGIKPITIKTHNTILPKLFHIDIPEKLAQKLYACKNNAEAKKIGVEWAIEQCNDLIKNEVQGVHFFSMCRTESIRDIAKEIFKQQ